MVDAQSETWTLEPEHELRLEVGPKEKDIVTLKVENGNAEIFGTELAPGVEYQLPSNAKVAVFSWQGAKLQTRGSTVSAYTATDTPMPSYLNVHLALEGLRRDAVKFSTSSTALHGPRVMVLGPSDVGKSSLCKILVNYSVKMGNAGQVYADLDPYELAGLSMPGSISASVFSRVVDVEEGMGGTLVTTGTSPIVFYYGYELGSGSQEKEKVFSTLVGKLAEVVDKKVQSDAKGIIINTPSYFSEPSGQQLLFSAIEQWKPTVLLVVGHEKLYSDLSRRFQKSGGVNGQTSGKQPDNVTVLKLAKSGGVVSRDKAFRRALTNAKVREYFYGTLKSPLNPFSLVIPFHELAVRRIGDSIVVPSSIRPIGYEQKDAETKIVKVEVGNILLNSVLAVSHADRLDAQLAGLVNASAPALTADEETALIMGKNVAGFIYISEVDDVKKKLTVLAPSPGRLPKKYMVMASLKWFEMH